MDVDLCLHGFVRIDGREIALHQTFALLDGIAAERSVRGAAERLNLSYRSAWGRLSALEAAWGQPVVVKTKGHGTVLTALGTAFRDALGMTLNRFEALLAGEGRALEGRLAALLGEPTRWLAVAASHDPLLAAVLAEISGVSLTVAGSLDAAERFRAGTVDAAGFHDGATDRAQDSPFSDLFTNPDVVVHPLFRREQGLILAPGNPLEIRSVRDLVTTRARFVNRQRGSGTRLWFDRLLAEAGAKPSAIVGYAVEEFTHQAVAALIASGAADAGMGLRAVADRFGLAFATIGEETYYLAVRAARDCPLLDRLPESAREQARTAPGYQPFPA